MIDSPNLLDVVILNLPNFVGFVVLTWALLKRLDRQDSLIDSIMDKCLDGEDDGAG
jgi:hypothetical protein